MPKQPPTSIERDSGIEPSQEQLVSSSAPPGAPLSRTADQAAGTLGKQISAVEGPSGERRTRSSSPRPPVRSSSTVAERRNHFESLEQKTTSNLRTDNARLHREITELRQRNSALERQFETLEYRFHILESELQHSKGDARARIDLIGNLRSELQRVKSRASDQQKMHDQAIKELKFERDGWRRDFDSLQEQLRQAELNSVALRSRASSPVPDGGDQTVSRLPLRPAFDDGEVNGIPEWALGQFLYDQAYDQWHESMLQQMLLRAQIAQYSQQFRQALNLSVAAAKHAFALNNMPLLARCAYYRGCAEYALSLFKEAVLSLEEAQAAKGRYIEGTWSNKSLRLARKRWQVDNKESPHTASILDEAPVFTINNRDMIVLSAARWLAEDEPVKPKKMSATAGDPEYDVTRIEHKIRQTRHRRRASSEPSLGEIPQFQGFEDESVLLRPPDAPDDGYTRYYNAIIPAQKQRRGHKRSATSLSDISLINDLSDKIIEVSNVEAWRVPKSRHLPADLFGRSDGKESSVDYESEPKQHRKRPSQLNIERFSNIRKIDRTSMDVSNGVDASTQANKNIEPSDKNQPAFQFPVRPSESGTTTSNMQDPTEGAGNDDHISTPDTARPIARVNSESNKVSTPATAIRKSSMPTPLTAIGPTSSATRSSSTERRENDQDEIGEQDVDDDGLNARPFKDRPSKAERLTGEPVGKAVAPTEQLLDERARSRTGSINSHKDAASTPGYEHSDNVVSPSDEQAQGVLESGSPARRPHAQSTSGSPAPDKAAKLLGITSDEAPPLQSDTTSTSPLPANTDIDRRSSVRNPNDQPDTPEIHPSFERKVSFASPTKRRKPSTKRLSFPAPWMPSPDIPSTPSTPSEAGPPRSPAGAPPFLPPKSLGQRSDARSSKPILPLKGLASPRSVTSEGPPSPTPRFVPKRSENGVWRLELTSEEDEGVPPITPPPNLAGLDLESEMSAAESPDSPNGSGFGSPGEAVVDLSPDARRPSQADTDGDGVSSAVHVDVPLSPGLKSRSPRKKPAEIKGIDTVLANASGSPKLPSSSKSSQSGSDEDRSPHVKFAGRQNIEMPTLERRVSSNHERRVSSAELAYTPKNLVHRSPAPQTPQTSSSTYSPRTSSPYGPPLSRVSSGSPTGSPAHVRAASYSPLPLSRQGTFPTPLKRTVSFGHKSDEGSHLSPTQSPSPGPEGKRRPSPLKRASLNSFPILSSNPHSSRQLDSPKAAGSPALDRVRERRTSSWGLDKVKNLLSPAFGSFKRYSSSNPDEDAATRDEEAAFSIGEDTEEEREDAAKFTDDEEGGVGLKAKKSKDAELDEEAGLGAQDAYSKDTESFEEENVSRRKNKRGSLLPTTEKPSAQAYEKADKMPGHFGVGDSADEADVEDAHDRV